MNQPEYAGDLLREVEMLRFERDWARKQRDDLVVVLNLPVVQWAVEQATKGRRLVALIPPTEAHAGPRYAGYYCEDGPS